MSMNCLEFRRVIGADAGRREAGLLAHRLECSACDGFARNRLAFDRKLEAALKIPVPADLPSRIIWRQSTRRRRPRWLAAAAGILLAAGLGFGLLQFRHAEPLPAAVVAHIRHEPELLLPPRGRADAVRVSAVLEKGGVWLTHRLDNIVHAGLCPFRGRWVPHVVIELAGEPVSILLMPHETLDVPHAIDEDGFRGVIVPHNGGSMAIVGAREELIVPVRSTLEATVNWTL